MSISNLKAFKTANLYILNVKKKTYLVSIVLAAICLVAGIYSLFFSKEDNKTFLGVAFIVLGLLPIYSLLTMSKKIDKSIINFFGKNAPYNQYLEITEESVTLVALSNGSLERAIYDWAYIQEIIVLKDYYLLFLNGNIPLIVSRNAEDVLEGTQGELAEVLRDKGYLKPYRVYEKEIIKNFVDPVNYLEMEEENLEDVLAKFAEPVVEVEETEEVNEIVENVEEVQEVEIEEQQENLE